MCQILYFCLKEKIASEAASIKGSSRFKHMCQTKGEDIVSQLTCRWYKKFDLGDFEDQLRFGRPKVVDYD